MKRIYLLLLVLWALGTGQAWACTGFVISSGDPDTVIAAKNEDYRDPDTVMEFVQPMDGTMGYVLFGYADSDIAPQGGMNQAGLVFDSFTVDEGDNIHTVETRNSICRKILSSCATVEEAREILKGDRSYLEYDQWLISDASGNAILVDHKAPPYDKVTSSMVVTNFRYSDIETERKKCLRFQIAERMLRKDQTPSVENARRILSATHEDLDSPTQYSVIYEPAHARFHLYYFHNFEEELVIDLKNIQLYNKKIPIPDLFHDNFAAYYYNL